MTLFSGMPPVAVKLLDCYSTIIPFFAISIPRKVYLKYLKALYPYSYLYLRVVHFFRLKIISKISIKTSPAATKFSFIIMSYPGTLPEFSFCIPSFISLHEVKQNETLNDVNSSLPENNNNNYHAACISQSCQSFACCTAMMNT